jgi:hypothetical protein
MSKPSENTVSNDQANLCHTFFCRFSSVYLGCNSWFFDMSSALGDVKIRHHALVRLVDNFQRVLTKIFKCSVFGILFGYEYLIPRLTVLTHPLKV